ncbi:hypothetical protein F0Q45_22885 [Mycobacterium simiae]|uniref:IstB-like ATP-binding domain-containing protein n=1 Tax=Mycobacterium simiae TaxID=1784 RepID=A0A5B1BGE4_MYCSI|nr:hypothetical protein F0Q45_22885 [Mycobacterium simiae]
MQTRCRRRRRHRPQAHRRTGHLPLPSEAASAVFQVVSQRYFKTSIVITTNRGSAPGARSSAIPPITAAMLDRFLHRSAPWYQPRRGVLLPRAPIITPLALRGHSE